MFPFIASAVVVFAGCLFLASLACGVLGPLFGWSGESKDSTCFGLVVVGMVVSGVGIFLHAFVLGPSYGAVFSIIFGILLILCEYTGQRSKRQKKAAKKAKEEERQRDAWSADRDRTNHLRQRHRQELLELRNKDIRRQTDPESIWRDVQ